MAKNAPQILNITPDMTGYTDFKAILEQKGFAVQFTNSGKEGFTKAQLEDFDIIAVDINIKDIGSLDLLKMMKEQAKSRNASLWLFVGNVAPEALKVIADTKLVNEIIQKPIDIDKVIPKAIKVVSDKLNFSELSGSKKKVMILDDDRNHLAELGQHFQKLNIIPFLISSAYSAVNDIREHKPDIFIMTTDLKNFDSFGLLRVFQKDNSIKDIPVILYSASPSKKDLENAVLFGVKGFMRKPLNMDQFTNKVFSVLLSVPNASPEEDNSAQDVSISEKPSPSSVLSDTGNFKSPLKMFFSKVKEILFQKIETRQIAYTQDEKIFLDFAFIKNKTPFYKAKRIAPEILEKESYVKTENILSFSQYLEKIVIDTLGQNTIYEEQTKIEEESRIITEKTGSLEKLQKDRKLIKRMLLKNSNVVNQIKSFIGSVFDMMFSEVKDIEIQDIQRLLTTKLNQLDNLYGIKKQRARMEVSKLKSLLETKSNQRKTLWTNAIEKIDDTNLKDVLNKIRLMDMDITTTIFDIENAKNSITKAQNKISNAKLSAENYSSSKMQNVLENKLLNIESRFKASHYKPDKPTKMIFKENLENAFLPVSEYDPNLFKLRLAEIKGPPVTVVVPAPVSGYYDADLHMFVIPLFSDNYDQLVIDLAAMFRMENDRRCDNYKLEKKYQELYSKSVRFSKTFINDYNAWIKDVSQGRKGALKKDVLSYFIWEIGPDPYDYVLPSEVVQNEIDNEGNTNDNLGHLFEAWGEWEQKNYKNAYELLKKANDETPNDFRTLFNLSLTCIKLKDLKMAYTYMNSALGTDEQSLYKLQAQELILKINTELKAK